MITEWYIWELNVYIYSSYKEYYFPLNKGKLKKNKKCELYNWLSHNIDLFFLI